MQNYHPPHDKPGIQFLMVQGYALNVYAFRQALQNTHNPVINNSQKIQIAWKNARLGNG